MLPELLDLQRRRINLYNLIRFPTPLIYCSQQALSGFVSRILSQPQGRFKIDYGLWFTDSGRNGGALLFRNERRRSYQTQGLGAKKL